MTTFIINPHRGGATALTTQWGDARATTSAGATSKTFSTVNFNAAATTRRIFVLYWAGLQSSSYPVTGISIGGVAATMHHQDVTTAACGGAASATVPSGTSGSVVFSAGQNIGYLTMEVYAVYGLSAVPTVVKPTSTASYGTNPGTTDTLTANAPANSVFIGASFYGDVGTITSSDATIAGYLSFVRAGGSSSLVSAYRTFSSAASSQTISFSTTGGYLGPYPAGAMIS